MVPEIVFGVIVIAAYIWYAVIVARRNRVDEALAGIDVQLTKRHELIPNVLTIARKFMDHEKSLLADITELRTKASANVTGGSAEAVAAKFGAADALTEKLNQLFISVEAYPELKSHQTMQTAQVTLNEVETQLAAARRFYNSAVADLNTAIEIFPGTLLAGLAHARRLPPYNAPGAHKATPVAADYF